MESWLYYFTANEEIDLKGKTTWKETKLKIKKIASMKFVGTIRRTLFDVVLHGFRS